MRVARHTIVALSAIHRMSIVHGAICPAHIQYRDSASGRRFKLGYFTCACVLSSESHAVPVTAFPQGIPGPAQQYAAPERWQASGQVTEKADVFSYGTAMYHCFTGRLPHRIVNGEIKPITKQRGGRCKVPENMYNLLEQCMRRNPENRLTIRQVEKRLSIIMEDLVQHDSSFAKGNRLVVCSAAVSDSVAHHFAGCPPPSEDVNMCVCMISGCIKSSEQQHVPCCNCVCDAVVI
jgi:serine/threonine protein kinase